MTIGKLSTNLKEALGYYNEGTTIPAATNTDGATNLQTGQTNGQIEVVLSAATAIAVAITKTITLTVTSSATVAGTFTAVGVTSYLTVAATAYNAGDEILTFLLPTGASLLEFTKVNVATDDAGATGTYDCAIRRIVS